MKEIFITNKCLPHAWILVELPTDLFPYVWLLTLPNRRNVKELLGIKLKTPEMSFYQITFFIFILFFEVNLLGQLLK